MSVAAVFPTITDAEAQGWILRSPAISEYRGWLILGECERDQLRVTMRTRSSHNRHHARAQSRAAFSQWQRSGRGVFDCGNFLWLRLPRRLTPEPHLLTIEDQVGRFRHLDAAAKLRWGFRAADWERTIAAAEPLINRQIDGDVDLDNARIWE